MSKARELSQDETPVPQFELSDSDGLPTLKGQPGVIKYARSLGFPTTARYVREETRRGSLGVFRVANAYWYSRRDVRDWLMSKRADAADGRPSARGASRK
jgi:hypothetical protein